MSYQNSRKLRRSLKNYKQHLLNKDLSLFQRLVIWGLSLATIGYGLLTIVLFLYGLMLPNVTDIQNHLGPNSTDILDANGKHLYTLSEEQIRDIVPLERIPKHLIDATLAIEDDEFYKHRGFDVGAIIKAFLSEAGIGSPRGGSTITQQLVKNTFLTSERSYTRKIKELILSTQLERKFSKDEILEMYLNQIPYGGRAYGAQQASEYFFNKNVEELTLAEAAILASLPQAPSRYSPFGSNKNSRLQKEFTVVEANRRKIRTIFDLDESEYTLGLIGQAIILPNNEEIYLPGRSDNVLKRMEDLDLITKTEREIASGEAQQIAFNQKSAAPTAPHFVFYINDLLNDMLGQETVAAGGLTVYTSLDLDLQEKAEELVRQGVERNAGKDAPNMSLVSLDNNTGRILAMVGSANYFNEEDIAGSVNMVTSKRQPGSSFKPFVFAKAFTNGYGAGTILWDVQMNIGGNSPNNYDGGFVGPISIRRGLAQSRNIPAIKAYYLADEQDGILEFVKKLNININPDESYGYPLALGSGELTQLELAHAYTAFANIGYQVPLTPILKVEDHKGNILYEAPQQVQKEEVLDPEAAYLITDILSDTENNLGPNLELRGRKAAAKTGTSNVKLDNGQILPNDTWTAGYTPQLTTVVWSGDGRPGKHMKGTASGYSNAAPTWKSFMEFAHEKMALSADDFIRPEGIKSVKVSRMSGLLPSDSTPESMTFSDLFPSYGIPKDVDSSFARATVDLRNGLLTNQYCPEDHVGTGIFLTPKPVKDLPGWQESIYGWLRGADKSKFSIGEGSNIFFSALPKEQSDLCTAEFAANSPTVSIVSPSSLSSVDYGSQTVTIEYNAPNSVDRVEYYVDDSLHFTSTSYPYNGSVRIPPTYELGSSKTIKVKIYDSKGYSDQSIITVKIGPETTNQNGNGNTVQPLLPNNANTNPGNSNQLPFESLNLELLDLSSTAPSDLKKANAVLNRTN